MRKLLLLLFVACHVNASSIASDPDQDSFLDESHTLDENEKIISDEKEQHRYRTLVLREPRDDQSHRKLGRTNYFYSSLGCYKDTMDRALPVYKGINMKTGDCMFECLSSGYQYFGIQYYHECWCGGTSKTDQSYKRHGPANGCDCDDPKYVGTWKSCVYRIWPPSYNSDILPEVACMEPSSTDEDAIVSMGYCPEGGENIWRTAENGKIKLDGSERCLHLTAASNEVELRLKTCSNGEDSSNQQFELSTNCDASGCVHSKDKKGTGYSGKCTVGGTTCEGGKIWNYDKSMGSRVTVPDCASLRNLDPTAPDGNYVIKNGVGDDVNEFTVYCHDMANNPREYIPLNDPTKNYSQFQSGGAVKGSNVVTRYSKVRLDPYIMKVDVSDQTFTTSTGSLTHTDGRLVTSMPYGVAFNCIKENNSYTTAQIDLRMTDFYLTDEFETGGWKPMSSVKFNRSRQVVNLKGGGYCGGVTAEPYDNAPFNDAGGFVLDVGVKGNI